LPHLAYLGPRRQNCTRAPRLSSEERIDPSPCTRELLKFLGFSQLIRITLNFTNQADLARSKQQATSESRIRPWRKNLRRQSSAWRIEVRDATRQHLIPSGSIDATFELFTITTSARDFAGSLITFFETNWESVPIIRQGVHSPRLY
jgi:hypothetical protein